MPPEEPTDPHQRTDALVECLVSGERRPATEMLPCADGHVAPEYADRWLRLRMEGGRRTDGDHLIGVPQRGLALLIDLLVKLLPVSLAHLPYYFATEDLKGEVDTADPAEFAGMASSSLVGVLVLAKLIQIVISAGYEIGMVGRFGATLGKMAVGARITLADGAPVGYGRAALRWAAKSLLNGAVFWTVVGLPLTVIGGLLIFAAVKGIDLTALVPIALWGFAAVVAVFFPVSLFPYWMAWVDPDRRALHDRIAATRVRSTRCASGVVRPSSSGAVANCPSCSAVLPPSSLGRSEVDCPSCGATVTAWRFADREASNPSPADAQRSIAAAIAGDGEARCRFFPELKAASVCEGCGALLSRRAAVSWSGLDYCLPCVDRLREDAGRGRDLLAGLTRHDNVALLLVTLLSPASLLTAPVALYLLLRYRHEPRSLVAVGRGRRRWWLALVLASLALIFWLGLLVAGISLMVDALVS